MLDPKVDIRGLFFVLGIVTMLTGDVPRGLGYILTSLLISALIAILGWYLRRKTKQATKVEPCTDGHNWVGDPENGCLRCQRCDKRA